MSLSGLEAEIRDGELVFERIELGILVELLPGSLADEVAWLGDSEIGIFLVVARDIGGRADVVGSDLASREEKQGEDAQHPLRLS